MLLLLLAYLGGILTILSPCILPVLPFVFARTDQPFRRSGLPLLVGMAATFALVASLATVGGGWAVRANQWGRTAALLLFALFGLSLLFASLSERLTRPLVRLGGRLTQRADASPGIAGSLLLGIGVGFLWAPCAGPILGLLLAGTALSGAHAQSLLLLAGFAAGAATSLALALLAGARVFEAMKRSLAAELWIRRGLGVLVLTAVLAVACGVDRGLLTRLSLLSTSKLEERLVARVHPAPLPVAQPALWLAAADARPAPLPALAAATVWINSSPLTAADVRGKVVLVDFWTYSCINCLRTLPYLNAWYEKYKADGLVVIGIHTPEFPFEKDEANVRRAVAELGIHYPVVMDNDYALWRAFNNQYWPAHYFIDAAGRSRYEHFGEGEEAQSEAWIRSLLAEAHGSLPVAEPLTVRGSGALAASDLSLVQSPETYIGYDRAQSFASTGALAHDRLQTYRSPAVLARNQWALIGNWRDGAQIATLGSATGGIVFRFHARDLHLVLGPATGGKPVRFRVTLDGLAPGADHGADTNAEGYGTVTEDRLYQLIRQSSTPRDRTFQIDFLDPGVQAFAFTFG